MLEHPSSMYPSKWEDSQINLWTTIKIYALV
jgi:hypothetical protein